MLIMFRNHLTVNVVEFVTERTSLVIIFSFVTYICYATRKCCKHS